MHQEGLPELYAFSFAYARQGERMGSRLEEEDMNAAE
jgi:hypothetical protein